MWRILKHDGTLMIVSYAPPERRTLFFEADKWDFETHKLYNVSLKEEDHKLQEQMMEVKNLDLKKSDFYVTFNENMTETNLDDVQLKNFHYVYICRKKEQIGLKLRYQSSNNDN